jgi:hypothetical protein
VFTFESHDRLKLLLPELIRVFFVDNHGGNQEFELSAGIWREADLKGMRALLFFLVFPTWRNGKRQDVATLYRKLAQILVGTWLLRRACAGYREADETDENNGV